MGPGGHLQVQCPVSQERTANLRISNHLKWAAPCLSFALEKIFIILLNNSMAAYVWEETLYF